MIIIDEMKIKKNYYYIINYYYYRDYLLFIMVQYVSYLQMLHFLSTL